MDNAKRVDRVDMGSVGALFLWLWVYRSPRVMNNHTIYDGTFLIHARSFPGVQGLDLGPHLVHGNHDAAALRARGPQDRHHQ